MNVLELALRHVQLKKVASTKGGEYCGPCPGCGGRDRFHVWPEDKGGEGGYWCRGCEKAGDSIQFLMDFEGTTFREACAQLGLDMPALPPAPKSRKARRPPSAGFEPKPTTAPAEIWRAKAAKLTAEAHARLHDEPAALKWLAGRGIDAATIDRFRLGWIDRPVFRPRESWGLETIRKEDGKPKMLCIPRGILIPSAGKDEVFRLRVRRPKADIDEARNQKKYYVVPGSAPMSLLVGAGQKALVVVETELDAMMIHAKAGDLAGVVALGSSSAKPDERCHRGLARAAAILVALDFDRAGRGAWKFWQETYPEAERWPVPIGKDPGEAFARGLDIRAWILAGLPPAWHIAPAAGPRREEAATAPAAPREAAAQATEPAQEPDLPPTVKELHHFLARYPIRIRATRERTTMLSARGFKNEGVLKKVSRLIFFDPDCWAFLHAHPAKIIDGYNFTAPVRQA